MTIETTVAEMLLNTMIKAGVALEYVKENGIESRIPMQAASGTIYLSSKNELKNYIQDLVALGHMVNNMYELDIEPSDFAYTQTVLEDTTFMEEWNGTSL